MVLLNVMGIYYSLALLVSLCGLAYGDWAKKLVIFRNPKVSLQIIALGMSFFLLWDSIGILLQVFATNQKYVTGLHLITPDLPIEEFMFLALLCYVTLISWRLVCLRTS